MKTKQLTRESNSDELQIVATQLSVVLIQMGEAPTVAFARLLERIEVENTQIELGVSALTAAEGD